MKKFKEFEVKNLEQVMGGLTIVVTISGIFDGIKGNGDCKVACNEVTEKN